MMRKKNKTASKIKTTLVGMEQDYTYEIIAPIRQIAYNQHLVKVKKEEERAKIDKQ